MLSAYTGRPLTAADVGSASFWARQLSDTVHFGPTLGALLADDHLLVEAGAGRTLTSFALRQPAVRRGASTVLPLLPGGAPGSDLRSVLDVRAALWVEGHPVSGPARARPRAASRAHPQPHRPADTPRRAV